MLLLFYRILFWAPALVSSVAGRIAWGNGLLRHPFVVLTWFAVALAMQIAGMLFSRMWAVGLGAQTALAVYLLIRLKTTW